MDMNEILRDLINKTGLNVKAFSAKAGLPYSTLRSMLERDIGNASVNNVIKVCKALGITVEQLQEMTEEKCLENHSEEFETAEAAMQFILKQPAIAAYGGFDVNKMSDKEIIDFANELLRQLKLLGYKYSK